MAAKTTKRERDTFWREQLGILPPRNALKTITAIATARVRKVSKAIPGVTPGVCRVCSCEDDHACEGGCYWLDEAHTLCSVCGVGFLNQVVVERGRQIAKWGNHLPRGGFMTLSAVLSEETGEVSKAILEGNRKELAIECVQVAAVAMRILEYLSDGHTAAALTDHNQVLPSFKKAKKGGRS